MTADIEDRARAEIAQLHRFFQDWFNGALPETDEAFARFESVLDPRFEIVPPAGAPMPRAAILDSVRRGYGGGKGMMRIWIRKHRHRLTIGELVLVAYEEWQTRGDGERGRLSSALLRADDDAPNGLSWLHVHETWLTDPRAAPPA